MIHLLGMLAAFSLDLSSDTEGLQMVLFVAFPVLILLSYIVTLGSAAPNAGRRDRSNGHVLTAWLVATLLLFVGLTVTNLRFSF